MPDIDSKNESVILKPVVLKKNGKEPNKAIVTHDIVVNTNACLKSKFCSLFILVAKKTDIPKKRVITAELKKFIQLLFE
jgi:hypothetical protein